MIACLEHSICFESGSGRARFFVAILGDIVAVLVWSWVGMIGFLRSENGGLAGEFAVTIGRRGTDVRWVGGDWCVGGPVGWIFR